MNRTKILKKSSLRSREAVACQTGEFNGCLGEQNSHLLHSLNEKEEVIMNKEHKMLTRFNASMKSTEVLIDALDEFKGKDFFKASKSTCKKTPTLFHLIGGFAACVSNPNT